MCGWLEQQEKDGKWSDGDKAIWGAEVEFMSLVSTPAVTDSEFLMIKEKAKDPSKIMVKGTIPLLKSLVDDKNRMIYAPALIPDKVDGNKEAISKDEIKKAAIKYMEHYRKVDNEHSFMDGDGIPIFSWPLQHDETFKTLDGKERTYPEGTWMMGIKITNEDVWKMIQSGERTGFSIAGSWKVLEVKSIVRTRKDLTGDVIDFFIETPPKNDADVHKFAENLGKDPDVVEGEIYDVLSSFLTKGRSKGKTTVEEIADKHGVSVDLIKAQLKMGLGVEVEHTDNPRLAGKIAIDHLIEMPDYYDKLSVMEEKLQSSFEMKQSKQKVKDMEPEEVEEIVKKVLAEVKSTEAEEQSQKEAEETIKKLQEELATVKTALEELTKDSKPAEEEKQEDEDEEEEEEKKQDDEEEEDEEKEGYEDEDEEEEEKKSEKATKSYDTKLPPDKKPKQTKGITNAKITITKKPLGDFTHE